MCGSDRLEATGLVKVAVAATVPAEESARTDAPSGISDRATTTTRTARAQRIALAVRTGPRITESSFY